MKNLGFTFLYKNYYITCVITIRLKTLHTLKTYIIFHNADCHPLLKILIVDFNAKYTHARHLLMYKQEYVSHFIHQNMNDRNSRILKSIAIVKCEHDFIRMLCMWQPNIHDHIDINISLSSKGVSLITTIFWPHLK